MKRILYAVFTYILIINITFINEAKCDPLFDTKIDYPAGDNPQSIYSADLDSDGDDDLAVANRFSDNVSIFLNNGNGTFQAAVNYGAGNQPYSIFATDLNGDVDIDLAVANYASNNVSILINYGNGTFQAAVNYGVGDQPYSVFAGDLNGDGDRDLAVANGGSNSVSILINNGNGTYQAAVNYGTGAVPHSVFAADFDGDNYNDLAVANVGSQIVSILINNGNGTFQTAVNYEVGSGPRSVFAADLDGDGNNDLAVANNYDDDISILKNNGNGTFQAAVNYAAGDAPWSVFASYLDGDEDIDLAVANYASDSVSIFLNSGNGLFQAAANYEAGIGPVSVIAADIDGDLDRDLAVVNSLSNDISILGNLTNLFTIHVSIAGNDTTGTGSQQNPFRTIQHGIDVAINGDTVLVADGTYNEHINFLGKNILVTSENGNSAAIISGIIAGIPVVLFDSSETNQSILKGFTVTNSMNAPGIKILNASPTIYENLITLNSNGSSTGDYGGGLYCNNSSVLIRKNIIKENSSGNSGGIAIWNSTYAVVDSNIISDNFASVWAGGTRLISSDSCIVRYNLIYNNVAGTGASAINLSGANYIDVINNTIDGNTGTVQGAVSVWYSNNCNIVNNIITNTIGTFGISMGGPSSCSVTYCDIYGNQAGNYSGVSPGVGCISRDPQYLGGNPFDYKLQTNSPCIDSGNPDSPYDPDSTITDMGALFFDQSYRILDFHLIEPANDAVVIETIQTFTWRSTEDIDSGFVVSYNLIWDDDPAFGSPDSTGIQPDTVVTLSDSLNRSTRYYWRVLASNGHADPIYSDETWSFYIDGYPTQPDPYTPENGVNADSGTIFTWFVSTDPDTFDAVSYAIQIDEDSLFASPEINQSGLSNTLLDEAFAIQLGQLQGIENLLMDTQYYWRLRSDDNYGLSSPWPDSLLYFTYMHQNHAPNSPDSGFSPANGEEIISLTPTIAWNAADDPDPDDVADSLYYDFYLFEDTSTGGQEYRDTTGQGINQITVADTLHDNAHFYYQVRTIDDEGLASGWSTLQNFWTNHYNYPPEPFPLYAPNPDHTQVAMYTHFTWGSTVDLDPMASFNFTFEYSPDSLFIDDITSIEMVLDTTETILTDLLTITGWDIYWRVLATDDDSLVRSQVGFPRKSVI